VTIVCDFGGESCDQILAVTESLSGNTAPEREAGKGAPAGTGSGFTPSSEGGDVGGGSETVLCRASDQANAETLSDMSPTLSCNKGAVPIAAQGADVYNGEVTGDTAATVTSATGIANASGPKVVAQIDMCGGKGQAHIGDGEVSFGLTADTQAHAVCSWNGDVTPKSSEDVSVTLRSQQGGEGVGVAAFGHNIQAYEGKMPPLRAGDDRGNTSFVAQQDSPQMNATLDRVDGETVEGMCEMRGATMVRRLTPMECERLQGFPDGWTSKRCILELEGYEWKPTGRVEEQKDGPRYRQMGNAVSVPVAEYIGRRMAEAVDE